MTWDEKIKDFEIFLRFERNFSDNTLDAYVRDIKKLKDYAEEDLENVGPDSIGYENLQEYIFNLSKQKFSERSQARWISSIKAFFKFLLEDEYREDNPAAYLKVLNWVYLPDTLSLPDINRLLLLLRSIQISEKETNPLSRYCMVADSVCLNLLI
jgi:integrase/recombinase XerD